MPVTSGVSQGSALGPLLFLLYVDEPYYNTYSVQINVFAEDALLYIWVKSVKLSKNDLSAIVQWSKLWQLNLNSCKCEALSTTNKLKQIIFTYFIEDQPAQWTNFVKYLEIQIK